MYTPTLNLEKQTTAKRRRFIPLKALIATTILGAIGATVWWWFWGSKPRIVLSIPIAASATGQVACWPTGGGTIAVFGGNKLTLVDLEKRTEVWQTTLPLPIEINREWQDSLSKRFLKLQQWSEDLAIKRAGLSGETATKGFNAEAARYAAELAATRADAARGPAPMPGQTPPPVVPQTPQKYSFGGDRSQVDKLKTVQQESDVMLKTRITKRAAQIAQLEAAIATLRPAATTPLKAQQLRGNEARLQLLAQEQKADETARSQPPIPVAPAIVERKFPAIAGDTGGGPPKFASLGEIYWLAEGNRVIGFNKSGGSVKNTIPLPGPVMRMIESANAVFVIAQAGSGVRYVITIEASGATRALYLPVSEDPALSETGGDRHSHAVNATRTEFIGGGPLAVAEIRLMTEKLAERQAIKPGTENAAKATVQVTADDGDSETEVITKVGNHDSTRSDTSGMEHIDTNTYQVSVRRPFLPATPLWTGEFTGRVQCISTPNLSLITAGKKLVALDANNAKAWESTLGDPAILDNESQWERAPASPCIEKDGHLYFFDRAALTAFNVRNGEVLWRLPSAGIRKVVFDGEGFLYIHCANRPSEGPASLSELHSGGQLLLMKVRPENGAVLWSAPKYDDVWTSGKDVYSMRVNRSGSGVEAAVSNAASQAGARSKIYKLGSESGKPRWEWFQTRQPSDVIANGKTIAILFNDELQVIHSTAL